ncbi:MAG: aminomethyl-transferring glycine dehydrogenase [Lentimicrobium sp.]|jgi:glycine dehydrogenase|nr:aminomethyl-transferring glycine dehydrogenase [Lentimicrobium sp.]
MSKLTNNFINRHNGPRQNEVAEMLKTIGTPSLDALIDETVPSSIRLPRPLNLPEGLNEHEYLSHLRQLGAKNKLFKSYIGMGYYNTIVPGVIQRNILENPGWYTSYTPYQAEISQGRLEALLVYQTMIADLTGMPLANASLLDEGTAAGEAMIMIYNSRSREAVKAGAKRFFISDKLYPQTIDVLKSRAEPLGIEVETGDWQSIEFDNSWFGSIVQYPDETGEIHDYAQFVKGAHEKGIMVAVAADLMSLAILTPPAEWGADVVVGSNQRFGLPMGYGGPHAGFFATREEYKRNIPGRIIGVSIDAQGNRALRMALQTREQHIKRERATSNICTAQALLAIMSGMYAVYHGPSGIRQIAERINILAGVLATEVLKYGYTQLNKTYFDTVRIHIPDTVRMAEFRKLALENEVNFRYISERIVSISLDETTNLEDVNTLVNIFASAARKPFNEYVCIPEECCRIKTIPDNFKRISTYLQDEVFNRYHSETAMMRFLKKLEGKDLSLNRSMIPLGSCTMKLNAAAELFALSWPEFNSLHPFVPAEQVEGYHIMIKELEKALCEITGFSAMSFQPNSGASGEYTGLLVIRAYHHHRGEQHRNICLIPSSAHGTNPASAVMAGMTVVVVKSDTNGNIDLTDLKEKAEKYKDTLSACMVTYPSTHGVFEEGIKELIRIIHDNGGQVYMDGANMNAQVGLTSPGFIGADVCHLNLHKTFAIPHGGGGPGVGPIGVAKHLAPFLPGHQLVETGGKNAIAPVASAPFGSASILTISYGYIKLLGGEGLTEATKLAILNANYLKTKLEGHYKILYTGAKGRVAHEMILDCNEFSRAADLQVIDIAKRLMDYGFHAPTVAFPVHGTLMVEPTESEPLEELNRFVEAMIAIRKEIEEIEQKKADISINVIKKAPHTLCMVANDNWDLPYSREKAAFPMPCDKTDKYWPSVTRIDDAYGDRNLVCSYSPMLHADEDK